MYLNDYVLCIAVYVHQSICMVCNNVRKYICTYVIPQCTYIHKYVQYTATYMYMVCSVQHVQGDHLTYVDQKFLIIRIRTHNASYSVCDVLVPNKSGLSSQWSPR